MVSALTAVLLGLAAVANASLRYKGVDWSSTVVEESAGLHFADASNKISSLGEILQESGVNAVRQRVWVNPADGNYSLHYNLQLAKKARDKGFSIYLDLHLSSNWADPGKQVVPIGWPTDMDALVSQVYDYTKEVCDQFHDAAIQPAIISIGNEITNGLLHPVCQAKDFFCIGRLLSSAVKGIKSSKLEEKPKIMIHLDRGWSSDVQVWFYSSLFAAGKFAISDFDMMGVSYYPFFSPQATLEALKNSLNVLATTWGKEIVIAETNWPVSCPNPKEAFPTDLQQIPFSPQGQTTWMKTLAKIVADIPGGVGLYYWEPAWVDNKNLGSSCEDVVMFDKKNDVAVARPSLSVFADI